MVGKCVSVDDRETMLNVLKYCYHITYIDSNLPSVSTVVVVIMCVRVCEYCNMCCCFIFFRHTKTQWLTMKSKLPFAINELITGEECIEVINVSYVSPSAYNIRYTFVFQQTRS